MRIHILDDWFDTLRSLPSFDRLESHDVTVWTDHMEDVDRLGDRLADAEALALFRERTPVGEALLSRLPRLQLISLHSAYPHIDVEACTRHGVVLSSNQQSARPSQPAAELTMALMLAAARQLPAQMASLRAGNWQAGVGQTLAGRRLGIYGYGGIGTLVAGMAAAFGMKVVWWGSEDGRARARGDGVQVAASREAFFAESDFVSLQVRLTPETRGLISAQDLLAMKDSACFINTSRAGLVAPGALMAALDAGRPHAIALDVFETEPNLDRNDPLLTHPRVIATPHIGFVTVEELERQFSGIYEQILAYGRGAPINVVNPDAFRQRHPPKG